MDDSVAVQVKRCSWEPRHEWEGRVKFVKDHMDEYGLEKAINLSTVWANMEFLGCKYPAKTEQLVSGDRHRYPHPDARKESSGSEKEASNDPEEEEYSYWDEEEEVDLAEGEETDSEDESAAEEGEGADSLAEERAPALKQPRVDTQPEEAASVSEQVSALISSIRKSQEGASWISGTPAPIVVTVGGEECVKGAIVTPTMKSISSKVCICDECTHWSESHRASVALGWIFRQYEGRSKSRPRCRYRLRIETASMDAFAPVAKQKGILEYSKKVIVEKLFKKATKLKTARLAIEIIHSCQEKHGRPACPLESGGIPK